LTLGLDPALLGRPQLAAPEELFSQKPEVAAEEGAATETVLGQGTTALFLDAILMDSSVRDSDS